MINYRDMTRQFLQGEASFEDEEKAKLLKEKRATAMGHTARGDELFDARDNLLGILETMNPDEAGAYIEDLIQELQMMQREM